jgi:transposase InsO family protein
MEDKVQKGKSRSTGKGIPVTRRQFSKSFKLRVVKMGVEDGLPVAIICKESGINHSNYYRWARQYRTGGEGSLGSRSPSPVKAAYPQVTDAIVSIKKDNPDFGVRRIVSVVRRWLFLPASKETVSRTLKAAELDNPPPRKRRCNVEKPRRFERSTPNQMWQSDIMMFRMGGRQVYLMGFIDDYSRYVTGMRLCMAQTADNLLEIYRKATAEHGVPKEMLTDNGRQYVNWRGVSRFQAEMQKDRVKHIRSAPHHPMTLGKIERFWQTIYGEYLVKAQFSGFEDAQERVRLWVQYYNHKRPHQGIEGLCPADRYFEVAGDVRKIIEAGVRENALELALRGKAKEPFYLVGRMDGQSVVLRARKGRLALTVDDGLRPSGQEHEFTIDKEKDDERTGAAGGGPVAGGETPDAQCDMDCGAESGGSAESVGASQHAVADMPGDEHHMDYIKPLAAAGNGGDAAGTRALRPAGQGTVAQSPSAGADPETFFDSEGEADRTAASSGEEGADGRLSDGGGSRKVAGAVVGSAGSTIGQFDGEESGAAAGDIAQELLRVAGTGAPCDEGCAHRSTGGASCAAGGCGEGTAAAEGGGTFRSAGAGGENHRSEEHSDRLRSAAEIALMRFGKAG